MFVPAKEVSLILYDTYGSAPSFMAFGPNSKQVFSFEELLMSQVVQQEALTMIGARYDWDKYQKVERERKELPEIMK